MRRLSYSTAVAILFAIAPADGADVRRQVLVVKPAGETRVHYFVQAAIDPSGGRDQRLAEVTVAEAKFLTEQSLDRFACIYVVDVPQLDKQQAAALRQRAAKGAGVCFFLGENVDVAQYNKLLYELNGGLMPLPLGTPAKLPDREEKRQADILVREHPVTKTLSNEEFAGLLSYVRVYRHHTALHGWKVDADKNVKVVARLRGGSPLMVERTIGKGRVMAILVAPDRKWTNWQTQTSWVVLMIELQQYLAGEKK